MTIISRKFYEPGGIAYEFLGGKCKPLPPDVAHLELPYSGKLIEVTWAQVMAERRKRQAEILDRIRVGVSHRAVRVMVWFNHCFPYEGYHTQIDAIGFSTWVRRGGLYEVLDLFPVTHPNEPLLKVDSYERWMPLFCEQYPDLRKLPHREGPRQYPRGVAYCWAECRGQSIDRLYLKS